MVSYTGTKLYEGKRVGGRPLCPFACGKLGGNERRDVKVELLLDVIIELLYTSCKVKKTLFTKLSLQNKAHVH